MRSWISRLLYPHHYRKVSGKETVRYAFPILAVTALFAGLASVSSQNASYITITTDPSSVAEDQSFIIEVKAYAHVPVNAVDIVLDYSENQMRVEGIDTGTSVISLWAGDPYAKDGKIYLRGGVFQKGFLGEHTIARVRARASSAGSAYVSVDTAALVAGDGKGSPVKVEKVSESETKITVHAVDGELKSTVSVAIVTDVDGDGSVDLSDISAFMSAWFTRGKVYDFNDDGRMTFRDFSILLSDSFFK